MPGTAQINFRVDQELKDAFYAKASEEMGSATRPFLKFMEAYVNGSFYVDDRAIGPLYMAVQSLHSYCNNINQVARKYNASGKLDPRFTNEFIGQVNQEIKMIVTAFKDVVTTRTELMQALLDSEES